MKDLLNQTYVRKAKLRQALEDQAAGIDDTDTATDPKVSKPAVGVLHVAPHLFGYGYGIRIAAAESTPPQPIRLALRTCPQLSRNFSAAIITPNPTTSMDPKLNDHPAGEQFHVLANQPGFVPEFVAQVADVAVHQ